jgi:hypothetical protein
MALKYAVGDTVTLTVDLQFDNPPNVSSGTKGTITLLIPSFDSYYVKFPARTESVQVFETQLTKP